MTVNPAPVSNLASHHAPHHDLFARLAGYRGPVSLPGTQREVWWTGRVAIGLLYQPGAERAQREMGAAEVWIQRQLLA